jgi:aquaporin Z
MNTRAVVSEFIGTFALIFIGAGAGALGVGGLVGVALAHGLVIVAFAYAYGHISGTVINPAATIGLWIGKQLDLVTAVSFIAAQFLGGLLGAFTLSYILGGTDTGLGATVLADGVNPIQGFFLEAILTFFLMNSIYHAAISGKAGSFAPLAIGFTLVFCILMGGPLTGASLNPARTFGPAVVTGNFSDIWVYFAGPIVGAVLAALLYTYVLNIEPPPAPAAPPAKPARPAKKARR